MQKKEHVAADVAAATVAHAAIVAKSARARAATTSAADALETARRTAKEVRSQAELAQLIVADAANEAAALSVAQNSGHEPCSADQIQVIVDAASSAIANVAAVAADLVANTVLAEAARVASLEDLVALALEREVASAALTMRATVAAASRAADYRASGRKNQHTGSTPGQPTEPAGPDLTQPPVTAAAARTFTSYVMSDRGLRTEAVTAIEALGYRCALDDDGDRWLVTIEHPATDGAAVAWTILQEDQGARSVPAGPVGRDHEDRASPIG